MPQYPGKNRPRVTISVAITIDGFLDSTDQERLIISNEEDLKEVHILRAESGAILVGAETIRMDDCSLTARPRGAVDRQPLRVTVTKSGNLEPGFKFFSEEGGRNLVFCSRAVETELRDRLGPDTEVLALNPSDTFAIQILDALHMKGVEDLMIEGGTTIITEFLGLGLVNRLRLSIGPIFAGDKGKNRLIEAEALSRAPERVWRAQSVSQLGQTVVIWYEARDAGKD